MDEVCTSGASTGQGKQPSAAEHGRRTNAILFLSHGMVELQNIWAVQEKSNWWRRTNRDPVQLTFGPMNYDQPLPSRNGKTIFAIGSLYSGELVRYDAKQKN